MPLNNQQKKYLRGLTHALAPVVIVAGKGLNEAVEAEIEQALDHHELIKVKLRGDRDERREWSDRIVQSRRAELVHQIGQVACYYRRNSEKQKIALP
jgi:RNA-binding protein